MSAGDQSSTRTKWPPHQMQDGGSTMTRLCATGSEAQRQHKGDSEQLTEISLSLRHLTFLLTCINPRGEAKFGRNSAVLREFYGINDEKMGN